ncbi:MAG: hypothetical protein ACE37B_20575 [Ilumatobacter sp.]|uniref:hypothetical protein n=1 Tax=Ilumatobacter sp. TaxID=1967498 RepID=UPI00391C9046
MMRRALTLIALLVASACGGGGSDSVDADGAVESGSDRVVVSDSLGDAASQWESLLDRVRADSVCPATAVVEWLPLRDVFAEVDEWLAVAPQEALIAGTTPPVRPGDPFGDVVEHQIEARRVIFENDGSWSFDDTATTTVEAHTNSIEIFSADDVAAAERVEAEVFLAMQGSESPLTVVIERGRAIFAGGCEDERTAMFEALFGETASEVIIALVGRTEGDLVGYFETRLEGVAPATSTNSSLPQYVPGLTDGEAGASGIDTAARTGSVVVELRTGEVRDEGVCLVSGGVLGECSLLGSGPVWSSYTPGSPVEIVVFDVATNTLGAVLASISSEQLERNEYVVIELDDELAVTEIVECGDLPPPDIGVDEGQCIRS